METVNEIIEIDSKKVVVVNEFMRFPRKKFNWKSVEIELKQYIGKSYRVLETKEIIEINKEFPDEFCHSEDTYHLRGANKRIKAGIIYAIPDLIEVATNKEILPNYKLKHSKKGVSEWNRYKSYFALKSEDKIRINIYQASVVVKCRNSGVKELYDIVRIKKRGEHPALE